MLIWIITFIALLLVVVGMSIGVLCGKKPLKGSCGGVGAALQEKDYVCDLCGGDEQKCEEQQQQQASKASAQEAVAALAYDATKK